jgi:hypothetical protein
LLIALLLFAAAAARAEAGHVTIPVFLLIYHNFMYSRGQFLLITHVILEDNTSHLDEPAVAKTRRISQEFRLTLLSSSDNHPLNNCPPPAMYVADADAIVDHTFPLSSGNGYPRRYKYHGRSVDFFRCPA